MAVTIQIISGNDQSAFTGMQFDNPIRVRLMSGSSGLAFTSVEFGVPDQGWPSGKWTSGTQYIYRDTDNSGYVNSESFVANNISGGWVGTINAVGADQVLFSATNKTRTPPTATTIIISGGEGQKQTPGAAYQPFSVTVQDQYGVGLPSTNVTFSVPSGYGTFSNGGISCLISTNASGRATSLVLTAGSTLGAFNVRAASGGAPAVNIVATNVDPTVVTQLIVVSGSGQKAGMSLNYANPLIVKAANSAGGGIAGKSVTFTSPALTGASLKFANATNSQAFTSDGSGNASTGVMTATATVGSFNVTVACAGAASITVPMSVGTVYLPTLCVMPKSPSVPINFGSGVNGVDWTNLALAIGNDATENCASNVQTGNVGNRSKAMLFTPKPASWSWMRTDCIIVDLVLWVYARGWFGAGPKGTLQVSFIKNGAYHPNYQLITWAGWGIGPAWVQIGAQFIPPVYPAANSMTGADLNLPNTGFGISWATATGMVGGAGFNINGAYVRVCYQDPYTPSATFVNVPLEFCEA